MSLKEKFKEKLIEALNEDVYKVEHEGHPDAATSTLYKHLPTGKKYTNHITKYESSAKKAASDLNKAGFKGVKVYKNWKLMEEVDLDEAIKPKTIPLGHPRHPAADPSHYLHSQWKAARPASTKVAKPKAPKLPKEIDTSDPKLHKALEDNLGGSFEHFEYTPKHHVTKDNHAAVHLTVTHSYKAEDFGYEHDAEDMAETHHVTAVRKNGKYEIHHRMMGESVDLDESRRVWTRDNELHTTSWDLGVKHATAGKPKKSGYTSNDTRHHAYVRGYNSIKGKKIKESVELDESKMSELHADIGNHMDKHIGEYRRAGGAEALMAHAAKATHKIAKMHGIEHKHAEKFVSDYIDSKLNEETLDESIMSSIANKLMGVSPSKPKYKVGQIVSYSSNIAQPSWRDGGTGKGRIDSYSNGHYMINGNPVNHFEITKVHEETLDESIKQRLLKSFNIGRGQVDTQ